MIPSFHGASDSGDGEFFGGGGGGGFSTFLWGSEGESTTNMRELRHLLAPRCTFAPGKLAQGNFQFGPSSASMFAGGRVFIPFFQNPLCRSCCKPSPRRGSGKGTCRLPIVHIHAACDWLTCSTCGMRCAHLQGQIFADQVSVSSRGG